MYPIILAGHFADFAFDPGVHAGGVGDGVGAGEGGPGVADSDFVTCIAGQDFGDARQNDGAGGFGQAGEAGDGCGLDAKERDENGVAATRVEVGQVVERAPGFHGLDGAAHAVVP